MYYNLKEKSYQSMATYLLIPILHLKCIEVTKEKQQII